MMTRSKTSERVRLALKECLAVNRALEETLVDLLAAFIPWLAPMIPAYLAWRNMTGVLEFHPAVALIGAAVVEFLGMATVHTTFMLWDYNDTKRKDDQAGPVLVAGATAGGYILIVLVVNVLLDDGPALHLLAQALLSLLSVIGAVTLAIRAQHARRLARIESDKAEKRQARQIAAQLASEAVRQGKPAGEAPESRRKAGDWRELSPEDRRKLAGMTAIEIAAVFPVSDRTARAWREKARKNGHNV